MHDEKLAHAATNFIYVILRIKKYDLMRHFWKIEFLFNLFKCKHYIVKSLQIFKL